MSDERLTDDERRRLDDLAADPYREEVGKLLRIHDADKATLARVRESLCVEGCGECAFVRRALASQPDAPCKCVGCRNGFTYCEVLDGQPEAPKEQAEYGTLDSVATKMLELQDRIEAHPLRVERDLAAANAKIAELEADVRDARERHGAQLFRANEAHDRLAEYKRISDAANARADAEWKGKQDALAKLETANARADAEFERGRQVGREDIGKYSNAIGLIESLLGLSGAIPLPETVKAVEALKARADAAERGAAATDREVKHLVGQALFQEKARVAAETERDQLASRVTQLERLLEEEQQEVACKHAALMGAKACTPEERKVLDHWSQAPLDYLQGLEYFRGTLPDWLCDLGLAELANRAAKDKRGGA